MMAQENELEAERNRENAEDGDGGVIDLAGTPPGHLVDDTHGLGIGAGPGTGGAR